METLRRILLSVLCLCSAAGYADAPVALKVPVSGPFQFVSFGDTRFTDPKDTEAANAQVRQLMVQAIADARPAFISIGGDITYNGNKAGDWSRYDLETEVWKERKIPVYPALGNHDLHGDLATCLANYFQRFPHLLQSRYYSVSAGNLLVLTLDSALDEVSGAQGGWLDAQLKGVSPGVEFVAIVLHHPPYTSSSDFNKFGGGHAIRSQEKALARFLEDRQRTLKPRLLVFASHVHNYEHHVRGGIHYFVTGGGGAHAYPVEREPNDLFQSKDVNYHFLTVRVAPGKMTITMNRLDLNGGAPHWTQPDVVALAAE